MTPRYFNQICNFNLISIYTNSYLTVSKWPNNWSNDDSKHTLNISSISKLIIIPVSVLQEAKEDTRNTEAKVVVVGRVAGNLTDVVKEEAEAIYMVIS